MEYRYGRKRSGIKRELSSKLEDWISTITDKSIAEVVKKNAIVTGGSIASMLLGEKVNDFDIYFRNDETTLLVAKYYVDQFVKNRKSTNEIEYEPEVRIQQIENIKKVVEDRVTIYMKSAGVAGEEQEAYRYFESHPGEKAEDFADSLIRESVDNTKPKYRPIFLSQNAITLSDKIQIVIRFFGEPNQIHENYDFVHAMCYFDLHKNELVLPSEALEALLSRTLVYKGSLYPVASIFRMKKFLERGWRITAGQQLKIMWQISEIDLSNKDVLYDQLTGVDQAYMFQLIEAIKGVDADKLDSAYISTIIDKIFE